MKSHRAGTSTDSTVTSTVSTDSTDSTDSTGTNICPGRRSVLVGLVIMLGLPGNNFSWLWESGGHGRCGTTRSAAEISARELTRVLSSTVTSTVSTDSTDSTCQYQRQFSARRAYLATGWPLGATTSTMQMVRRYLQQDNAA